MPPTYDQDILRSLRRIIRAVDRYSRKLSRVFNLTVPQIITLHQLHEGGECTAGELSNRVCLSQATMTGIVDRLEARGLLRRARSADDRRRVMVDLTPEGREVISIMPPPLQEQFAVRLAALPTEEQETINRTLALIVEMMQAEDIDASPILTTQDVEHLPDERPPTTKNI
ncbi:MAG: winged helix-turn-helix transcriptional regulator [Deltaproteobacteria bacterium]|nr:winged helix-turn-helix transcriptional regulator [Candidatus Anaeroferrophillacea bacterium]